MDGVDFEALVPGCGRGVLSKQAFRVGQEVFRDSFAVFAPFQGECTYCLARGAQKRCGRCKAAAYCSVQCQRKDWPCHKTYCALEQSFPQHSIGVNRLAGRMRFRDDVPWQQLMGETVEEKLWYNRFDAIGDGGGHIGAFACLANHSTRHANCKTGVVSTQHEYPAVVFYATREIEPGEEITISYVDRDAFNTDDEYHAYMQNHLGFVPDDR